MPASLRDPFVRKLEQYTALTETERQALRRAAEAHGRTLRAREDVMRQGDAVVQCCLVREGVLARYKLLPEGRRQITAFLLPGDWCDLAGFLSGRVEFGVAALGPARIACVPHQVLHALCTAHPNLMRALWQESEREAGIGREWIVNIGQREADQRLAHLLCELRLRFAAVGLTSPEDGGFDWPVTQGAMADAIGMTPVHVNRTLRVLRGMDVLDYGPHRVVLRDEAHLRRFSDFDAAYLGPPLGWDRGSAPEHVGPEHVGPERGFVHRPRIAAPVRPDVTDPAGSPRSASGPRARARGRSRR